MKKSYSTFGLKNLQIDLCSMVWNMKELQENYESKTNLVVHEVGFIVCRTNPWFGYSAHGVVFDNNIPVKLLEIKCPYKGIYFIKFFY